jgi:hypothetical protein
MNGDDNKERLEKESGEGERVELSLKPGEDQERIERGLKPEERMERQVEPERLE